METMYVPVLVASVIGFIGSIILANNVVKSTGKDLFSGFLRKLLMAVGGIGIMGFMSIGEEEGALPIALAMTFGALVILFLLNMKKEVHIAKIIILTVLEVLSGFVMVLVWGLSIMLKMINGGAMQTLDFDSRFKQAAEEFEARRKAEEEEKEKQRTYIEEVYGIDGI